MKGFKVSEPKINYLGPACEADIGVRRMNSQWKLVPVEPTETMVINGFESEPDECFTDEEVWERYQEMSGCQQAAFRAKLCWAAMLGSAPAPDTLTAAPEESAGVDFGIDGRSVRISQEAYTIFLAREASAREKIDALQLRLNAADQRIDELERDKDRLDAIEANFWDVRHRSSALADTGDYTSSIEIIGHWMDKPTERLIGEDYSENLRAAIDQAMTAPAYPPARPEYPEIDEALEAAAIQ